MLRKFTSEIQKLMREKLEHDSGNTLAAYEKPKWIEFDADLDELLAKTPFGMQPVIKRRFGRLKGNENQIFK